jgi:hypothetical protein
MFSCAVHDADSISKLNWLRFAIQTTAFSAGSILLNSILRLFLKKCYQIVFTIFDFLKFLSAVINFELVIIDVAQIILSAGS